jgi:hypothetical protein
VERIYLDFDLQIQRTPEGYRAQVLTSPAGQAAASFALPFSDLELENFLLRVGRPRGGTRRIDSPEVRAAKTFGERLFSSVFSGDVRGCLRSSTDEAGRQGAGLRIRLRLTEVPELADLPWEYLYNPGLNRFVALSAETPFVRYLDLPERIRALNVMPPLRVLVMISSPSDYPRLDVEQEWSKLQESVVDLARNKLVILERLENATLSELQRRLRRGEYHIFHFIGHGGFDQALQDGLLILENDHQRGRPVSGQDLGTLLHDHRALRLAVLNACEGARTARTDPFAGTAQSLVQQGLPAVIAMQFEITDEAAITFAHEFYAAVADGYPVDAAVAEARKAIFAAGNGLEWGTPVLYLRAADGMIFTVQHAAAPAQVADKPAVAPAEQATDTSQVSKPAQTDDFAAPTPTPAVAADMRRKSVFAKWPILGSVALFAIMVGIGFQWIRGRIGGDGQKPVHIVALAVVPAKTDIRVKDRVGLKLKASYSDGSTRDVTERVEWRSTNLAVGTVNSLGELVAQKDGITEIIARYANVESSPMKLSVKPADDLLAVPPVKPSLLVSLTLSASRQELKAKERLTVNLLARYADGREKVIAEGVEWQSSRPAVITVSSSGQVVGQSEGRADITARYAGVASAPLTLVVKSAEKPLARLVSLVVEGNKPELKLYESVLLRARAKYSDGTEKVMTGGVDWRSNQPKIVTVSADGRVEARSAGTAEVLASYGGLSSSPLVFVVKGSEKPAPQVPAENNLVKEYLSSAQAFREAGDYTAALAVLEKARQAKPNDKDVQAALETTRRACNAERRLGRTELKCSGL